MWSFVHGGVGSFQEHPSHRVLVPRPCVHVHNCGRHWLHGEDLPRPSIGIQCPPARQHHRPVPTLPAASLRAQLHWLHSHRYPHLRGRWGDRHSSGHEGHSPLRVSVAGTWCPPAAAYWVCCAPRRHVWPLLLCHFVRQPCQSAAAAHLCLLLPISGAGEGPRPAPAPPQGG